MGSLEKIIFKNMVLAVSVGLPDFPEVILPEPRDIDVRPWKKRKPRYYNTPYWPCPFYGVRMRYIYFSSKCYLELCERVYARNVTAIMKPVGWSLVVGFKRKRNPVPEGLRYILCVYVDARHIGHVEYVSEEVMRYGELFNLSILSCEIREKKMK